MKIDNKSWDTFSEPGGWQRWIDGLPEWLRVRFDCKIEPCNCKVKTEWDVCENVTLSDDEPS